MNLLNIFKKEKMYCSLCNERISQRDIEINNCISVITKAKTKKYAHKSCLVRR